ncbi:hypothetical protein QBC46DRAFT_413360 [Diplogelasinospora grovesii]|uniref:2EXR domain-containing protein n=1 Tax=Diplogelasinospora grovesii TaxID=303347 RepID=A0AAN6MX19_9PEZI|nr:hypothetical protein QBC46DRAFT_413360 [Diplogelasinospora grovesii]
MANTKQTFPYFRHLACEIRIMVWEAACQVERVVPVLPNPPYAPRHIAIPPVMETCRESRGVAAKFYGFELHPLIRTNLDRDLILLHPDIADDSFNPRRYPVIGFNLNAMKRAALYHVNDRLASHPKHPFWSEVLIHWMMTHTLTTGHRLREAFYLVLPPLTKRYPDPLGTQIELVERTLEPITWRSFEQGLRNPNPHGREPEDNRPRIRFTVRFVTADPLGSATG